MAEKAIITIVKKYIRSVIENGINVRFAVIYRSQVTGKTNEWSDIDLIVVSPFFDRKAPLDEIGKLWMLAAKTDTRLEPIPCGEKQWLEDESTPILEVARRNSWEKT